MDLIKFDKRIIDRNLEKGLVGAKEYEKYLSSLPDLENQYELIDLPLYEGDEVQEKMESEAESDPVAEK